MDVKVEVRGIRELTSAFKKVDADLPKALKGKMLGVAERVAGGIRGRVPKLRGRAAGSVKARGSTRGASIAFGGSAAPHMPWLNFGGRVGRNHRIVRDRVTPDRYVYTEISARKEDTEAAVNDAIHDVARGAGFETEGF